MDGAGTSEAATSTSTVVGDGGDGGEPRTAKKQILQIKVRLHELEPKEARAWRRLLVPADMTFDQFHWTIQRAFAWRGYHLYEFRIGTHSERSTKAQIVRHIEDSEKEDSKLDDSDDDVPLAWRMFGLRAKIEKKKKDMEAKETLLIGYFTKKGDKALYTYDMGDSWNHSIVVEKVLDAEDGKKYPQCIGGKRRAPPEDCGGFPGFEDLLRTLSKPPARRKRDEKETISWLYSRYPGYDPQDFDPKTVDLKDIQQELSA